MAENLDLKVLLELARIKDKDNAEYEKTMKEIESVAVDVLKLSMRAMQSVKDELREMSKILD